MWQPAQFLIATPAGPTSCIGYEYRGLTMRISTSRPDDPDARALQWLLSHKGSGGLLCGIYGTIANALIR